MQLKLLLSLFFVCFALGCFTQTDSDAKLAQYYYQNGDFEKATVYYQKLYAVDQTKLIYNRYIACLTELKEYSTVEKTIKKQITLNKKDLQLLLQLGAFYESINETKKSKNTYNEVLSLCVYNPTNISDVFRFFINQGKIELAKDVLDRGSKQMPDYPFQLLYAELYFSMQNKQKAIESYLDLLDKYPEYKASVQFGLEDKLDLSENSQDGQELKRVLLDKIQEPNSRFELTELLIWLFLQNKNFAAAYIQVVALDKRMQTMGFQVMDLGKIALENESFDIARKCFNYVINLGTDLPYFFEAETALLNARYVELSLYKMYSDEELDATLKEYKKVIDRIANARKSMTVVLEYAKVMAYFAGKKEAAITVLEQLMYTPGISDVQKASVKLLLADVYVLSGRIWDASILYMQIDNDFKFDVIGNEAKYKNARVFYFDGEFDYAQSQLNVLKESTSKLIANDAMQLSIAITDNFGLDSNYQAMMWFATADLFLEQNQIDSAFSLFDSIQVNFPFHSLNDEIVFKKGQAMEKQKKWKEAIVFYTSLYEKYASDILADDALFRLAKINEEHIKDENKALELYKELLFKYTSSLYSSESRNKIRALRGDEIIKDGL